MKSDKYNSRLLATLLKKHGCHRIIVAPGSRNAPIIASLTDDPDYDTFSVPDERAAAFTALGMALEDRRPAAVICTSGSAAANFLPAVTEAFYQRVPLIIITADRPPEWIGQGAGQTIMQEGLYGKHICAEANLHREPHDQLARYYNQRCINEVLREAHRGPVHLNVPFSEPLYEKQLPEIPQDRIAFTEVLPTEVALPAEHLRKLQRRWEESPKVAILAGQLPPSNSLSAALEKTCQNSPFLLFSETLSNLDNSCRIASIDRLLASLSSEERRELAPDLLITIGGEVVSKMIKSLLREFPPQEHWHVGNPAEAKDTFQALSSLIPVDPLYFLEAIPGKGVAGSAAYRDKWIARNAQCQTWHEQYLKEAPFSDLQAFAAVLKALPENVALHCANSASVRYSQLFDHPVGRRHYANRGTSGIDGSTSTALGHALVTDQPVTLITGDVAFLYDSAAFWNDRLPANLKIIVLNNEGGNIFRIIKGPAEIPDFERFQETHHRLDLSGVGKIFGIGYRQVLDPQQLPGALEEFYQSRALQILEIQTPRLESPEVLSAYFKAMRSPSRPE